MTEKAEVQKETVQEDSTKPLSYFDIYWGQITFGITLGISMLILSLISDMTTQVLIVVTGVTLVNVIGSMIVKGHHSIMQRLDQLESKE